MAKLERSRHKQIVLAARLGANATVLREVLESEAPVQVDDPTVDTVATAIEQEASLVVLTEEVLIDEERARRLGDCLSSQPAWSDIPMIILLKDCQRFGDCLALLGETTHHRSILLLELPLKRLMFATIVRACLDNRRRQCELRDTLYQLQESNQTLESFSYTAAHELRNPLGVMTSSFDLLARTTLETKQQKIVEMGQRTARNMNRMLGALLDYGKVRSQSTEFFTAVDMNSVVSEAVCNCRALIEERGVELSLADLPKVNGARQLLIQLIGNLVKNAIVHNDAKEPKVSISAEAESFTGPQSARWLFSIRDNGSGIEPEAQDKIFTMFNRAGKRRTEGSGIGLALCRRIVEQHKGEIGVRSEISKGSTFYFDLEQVKENNELSV